MKRIQCTAVELDTWEMLEVQVKAWRWRANNVARDSLSQIGWQVCPSSFETRVNGNSGIEGSKFLKLGFGQLEFLTCKWGCFLIGAPNGSIWKGLWDQEPLVKVCRLHACLHSAILSVCQLPISRNIQATCGPCVRIQSPQAHWARRNPWAGFKLALTIHRLVEHGIPFSHMHCPSTVLPKSSPQDPWPWRRVLWSVFICISAEELWNHRTTSGALFLSFPGTGANLFAQWAAGLTISLYLLTAARDPGLCPTAPALSTFPKGQLPVWVLSPPAAAPVVPWHLSQVPISFN